MRYLCFLVQASPVICTTTLDLFTTRIKLLDSGHERVKSLDIRSYVDHYNAWIPVSKSLKLDAYDATLYTILCGVSANTLSNDSRIPCQVLDGERRRTAETQLRALLDNVYPEHRGQVVPSHPPLVHTSRNESKSLNPFLKRQRDRTLRIRELLSQVPSSTAVLVSFDDVAKAWHDLLTAEDILKYTIDNKVLIYALYIINETGFSMDIPRDLEARAAILPWFCVVFNAQPLAWQRTVGAITWITECPHSGDQRRSQSNELIRKAKDNLHKMFEQINLGKKIQFA